jgi:hypothetical protein
MDPDGLKKQYTYQPLDTSQTEIRLVRLLPRNPQLLWDTFIDCEIIHVSLKGQPQYEALSYAWESERKPVSIHLDGKPLCVTLCLFSALKYLRGQEPRVLWVDAICIDQSSIPERNQQVSIMRDIYANAVCTNVWLGDFNLLPMPSYERDFLAYIEAQQDLALDPAMPEEEKNVIRNNLATISERSWFSRIWVVQELACSTGDRRPHWR